MDRRSFCLSTCSATLFAATGARGATPFPTRPVRIIVPYAAGGGPDVQARQIAPKLGEALGQTIVVENKVGAAGVLAAQFVAQARADGHTLLIGSNTHLIQKILLPSLSFDPLGEFLPVSNMAAAPTVLVVAANSLYHKVEDLIAAAKASPGKLNYGSGGVGTSAHLAGATLVTLNHLKVTHIPLKGSVEIALSLLRGDTDFAFPIAGTALSQVKGGKLRALAVTSAKRLKELPDVPTLNEIMHNELTVQESWFGFWLPAKTPVDVLATLYAAVARALGDPGIKATFEAAGTTVDLSASPQAYAAFVHSEYRKWAEIVKLTSVTAG